MRALTAAMDSGRATVVTGDVGCRIEEKLEVDVEANTDADVDADVNADVRACSFNLERLHKSHNAHANEIYVEKNVFSYRYALEITT